VLRITFNDLGEFAEELALQMTALGDADRPILRRTFRQAQAGGDPVKSMTLIAGFIGSDGLVTLELWLGHIFGLENSDNVATRKAGKERLAKLDATALRHGMSLRSGAYRLD
jgi:hypothetical protein